MSCNVPIIPHFSAHLDWQSEGERVVESLEWLPIFCYEWRGQVRLGESRSLVLDKLSLNTSASEDVK